MIRISFGKQTGLSRFSVCIPRSDTIRSTPTTIPMPHANAAPDKHLLLGAYPLQPSRSRPASPPRSLAEPTQTRSIPAFTPISIEYNMHCSKGRSAYRLWLSPIPNCQPLFCLIKLFPPKKQIKGLNDKKKRKEKGKADKLTHRPLGIDRLAIVRTRRSQLIAINPIVVVVAYLSGEMRSFADQPNAWSGSMDRHYIRGPGSVPPVLPRTGCGFSISSKSKYTPRSAASVCPVTGT